MIIKEKYVIYELNSVMMYKDPDCTRKTLSKLEFPFLIGNEFDTEKDAIQALIDTKKTYTNYVILKEVTIYED